MKKLVPFNITLFAILIVLSTFIYAYEKENGDRNAAGMYFIVYAISWIVIIGLNTVSLLIAHAFSKSKIGLYCFLLIVPLATIIFTLIFASVRDNMFIVFGIVGLITNSITAFKLHSQTNK